MRPRREVTLDAQFGIDIDWLRREFTPALGGTREAAFVPVRVVAPGRQEITLLILASTLYLLGWRNAHGEFILADHPDAPAPNSLVYSSHYQSLGVFGSNEPIFASDFFGAVGALSNTRTLDDANRLRMKLGLMALAIPESLRQDIVCGIFANLLAYGTPGGVPRSLIKHYVNNYSKQAKTGDPYVLLPVTT